ncbi:hypothetical protein DFH29DRAFT_875695 [Suillus ampliporus]|nr:hypothetical protein DFH29DRAFT_875695 [Suillus ampliporus]
MTCASQVTTQSTGSELRSCNVVSGQYFWDTAREALEKVLLDVLGSISSWFELASGAVICGSSDMHADISSDGMDGSADETAYTPDFWVHRSASSLSMYHSAAVIQASSDNPKISDSCATLWKKGSRSEAIPVNCGAMDDVLRGIMLAVDNIWIWVQVLIVKMGLGMLSAIPQRSSRRDG